MKEIIWKPELHRFSSCKEFVEEFRLGASDLILTNEYIYQPYFGAMNLECAVLYQEQYGMGEPTDVMAEAILRDAAATGCNRVVAIGGGTVIDIAKVLAVGGGESIDELYGMRHGQRGDQHLNSEPDPPGDEDGAGGAGHVRGRGGAHPAAPGGAALRGICDELDRRAGARGGVQPVAEGDAVYQAVRV